MKVLVTGGCGFIGSAVALKLHKEGHQVTVLDNLLVGKKERVSDFARVVNCDISDPVAMQQDCAGVWFDEVYHLAAYHFLPFCARRPVDTLRVNLTGSEMVMETLKARRYFFASTAAVYPNVDQAHKESGDTGPMEVYGVSKRAMEHHAEAFSQRVAGSASVVVGRLFNAYGCGDTNPHLFPTLFAQVKNGGGVLKLGNLSPKRDYIHVSDLADGIVHAARAVEYGYGVFNVATGIEHSVADVIRTFEEVTGARFNVELDPTRVRKNDRLHLLADVSRLATEGWKAKMSLGFGIEDMVRHGEPLMGYLREDVLLGVPA